MTRFRDWIFDLVPNIFWTIIFMAAFFMLARPVLGQMWRPGFKGHGTTHEKLGQLHFEDCEYKPYVSKKQYSQEREYSQMYMGPVFNFTHSLFDFLTPNNGSFLLPDYVEQTNNTVFILGQMYENNDWKKLLRENRWLLVFWFVPLLMSIIIMPFVAIIYCCFCCWRCKKPVATGKRTEVKRIVYSVLMLLLIIGLSLAFAITILSHKQMIRNVGYTNERLLRGTKDVCAFLKDVSNHLHHLFIKNVADLKEHIREQSTGASRHIFLDLVDTSDGNAIEELEKILTNMPEAYDLLSQLDKAEKNFRFYNSQLRDGLRGAKRDLILSLVSICRLKDCIEMTKNFSKVDASVCLHIDDMPNSTIYLNAVEQAIKKQLILIPYAAMRRLEKVGKTIQDTITPVIDPIIIRFDYAAAELKKIYRAMKEIIEQGINDIHLRTIRSARTFDDINEKFGPDRKLFTNIACLSIFLILLALIFGLVYGFFVRSNNTGSNCMIFAILLIFCTSSFITLVGLFHYVLGMVTYEATCKNSENFKTFDSNRLKIQDSISACRADQNIIDWLSENNLYQRFYIERVTEEKVETELKDVVYSGNLTNFDLITIPEEFLINKTLYDLYPYRSKNYTDVLCKNTTLPIRLKDMVYNLDFWMYNTMYRVHDCGVLKSRLHTACVNANWAVREFYRLSQLDKIVQAYIDYLIQKTIQLDGIISVKGRGTFGDTIAEILTAVKRTEYFIRNRGSDFINTIGLNLTESMIDQLDKYRNMTITEINQNLGHCSHIAYIQDHGTKYACRTLIDPINGFWVGLLLCSFLYVPILLVAHRLSCLYRSDPNMKPVVYLVRSEGVNCPTCTGVPFKHKPVIVCTGGQQKNCSCPVSSDVEVGFGKSKSE